MNSWLWCAAVLGLGVLGSASAEDKKGDSPVLGHKMNSLAGKPVDLSDYKGKVLLIVNTASQCGATPQYEDLQALHEKYSKEGLVVLGFPCNQFGKQEPGDSEEIATFCKKNYGVTFPMFAKVEVNGENASGLYKYLTSEEAYPQDPGKVKWNFEKFLISKDGKVVERFRTGVNPSSKPIVEAIERELKKES
jgi:glutathione peroxidase